MWVEQEGLNSEDTFLFMCFFVNNQFRMFVESSQAGADNLEQIFESNLRRIGKVVALLDHWNEPVYLSRVWTIYEQYTAVKLKLPVSMILPLGPATELVAAIEQGNRPKRDIRQGHTIGI